MTSIDDTVLQLFSETLKRIETKVDNITTSLALKADSKDLMYVERRVSRLEQLDVTGTTSSRTDLASVHSRLDALELEDRAVFKAHDKLLQKRLFARDLVLATVSVLSAASLLLTLATQLHL